MAEEIKAIINHANAENLRTGFHWVSGHIGVVGNEKQDAIAKSCNTVNENQPIPHTVMEW